MVDWFLNPGYLAAAAALISVPIIIHLINRMRFKRIRWAAMEFLLKAQKRNRRRLIIEQLLLLALRCLLIALVGLLVLRFVGFSFSDFAGKQGMHIVLIDDTLSTTDVEKKDGVARTSFQIAKQDVLEGKIVKALAQVNANDKLLLIPVTQAALDPNAEFKSYERISDPKHHEELKKDILAMEPTLMHASIRQAVERVQKIVSANADHRVTLHIVSDFRQRDWAESEELSKMLKSMVESSRDFKLRMIDVGLPRYEKGQATVLSHDNVGITDFRAGTRVASKGTKVGFTFTIENFSSREANVYASVFNDATGTENQLVQQEMTPSMPLRMSPRSVATVKFELAFEPTLKPGEPHFEQISVRLKSPTQGDLEGDGLEADNVRYATVEIREKVPILIVDGEGLRSRTDFDRDSFFVQMALNSVPNGNFELFWGDELGGGVAAKALERPDLQKFASIFLLNVRELDKKQLANLETFVDDGGGVCFFLGPQVNAKKYNEMLYKEGEGLFPAKLKEPYYPAPADEPRKVEVTGAPQLILREGRDEGSGGAEQLPIFGEVFKDPKQKSVLKDLPIHRYFKVPRDTWKVRPGTIELATLPNETPIGDFANTVRELNDVRLEKLLEQEEFKKYRKGLEPHRREIATLAVPGSDKLAYHLAPALDRFLEDRGDPKKVDEPNPKEFWSNSDPKVQSLRDQITKLRDLLRYGDPLVIAGRYGKGKVVAVLTTAGKEWNSWAGGSDASLVYSPFIWELQNYISSQSAEDVRTVGSPVRIALDAEPYRGKQLKAYRTYHKSIVNKAAEVVKLSEAFPQESKGKLVFDFPKNEKPGLYVTQIRTDDAAPGRPPIVAYGHVFNVDTAKEGDLERVGREEIKDSVIGDYKDRVEFDGPGISDDSLVTRMSDFSESPWLFLLFLGVLVSEQALAVHLSFHLKGSESDLMTKLAPR
jgi:hypothetical protein